ncbi:3-isopropylmalate dehydrogenase [Aureitalea sp. L0-47]|uniref:3-isopropylmalate dehydrogenase n=1 Tax=Aureitalea sp. L0-47 TaxID=2816962 RepID=UPI0022384076|nr:3-isopropylmalate dehydrogenase [Aureitalea sp. L0-47]MCW5518469.1 3-isopropylmalate dehydrogenase [Aureitalea sp. L0-47]
MNYKIAVLAGDGIGPEVTEQSRKALKAIGDQYNHTFEFTEGLVGAAAMSKTGDPLPEETLNICEAADAVLFGAIGDPKYDSDLTAKIRPEQGLFRLREVLGLFCNIRPAKTFKQLIDSSPLKKEIVDGSDFIIYRELTGGIYFGKKELSEDGTTAFDGCEYSVEEIERIAHLAFKRAMTRRKKLTLVDKANVLETSRLWRSTVQAMADTYPEVQLEFLYADKAAMQLVLNPKQFDVILTDNLFGDMLSDEAAVIAGSIGLLASASVGEKNAVFEPVHGSFPQGAGKDMANPLASILSAVLLLEYLKLHAEAHSLYRAVEKSLELGISTADINPTKPFSTSKVGDFIVDCIYDEDDVNVNIDNVQAGQSTII